MFLTAKAADKERLLYQSADKLSKINCNNFSSQQLLDLKLDQINCKKFLSKMNRLKFQAAFNLIVQKSVGIIWILKTMITLKMYQ